MLKVEADGAVLRLTLDRPDVRNALNADLISALYEAFVSIAPSTRVVVLAGEGTAFCAGADVSWMRTTSDFSIEENERNALKIAKMFQAVSDCPAVVVARVHGPAFGGGAGLVAAADVALATDYARFAFSEVRIGLVPATISPFVLSKIGASHARALFTTGEAFSAARAATIGLIHEVVPSEHLDLSVEEKVSGILNSGPYAVSEAKRLAKSPPLNIEEAAKLLARIRAGDEAKEGFTAFIEKRPASYVIKR